MLRTLLLLWGRSKAPLDIYSSVAIGDGFGCAVLSSNKELECWGAIGARIYDEYLSISMGKWFCGITEEYKEVECSTPEKTCSNVCSPSYVMNGSSYKDISIAMDSCITCGVASSRNINCLVRGSDGEGVTTLGVIEGDFDQVSVGTERVCGLDFYTKEVTCWKINSSGIGAEVAGPLGDKKYKKISMGKGDEGCAIYYDSEHGVCWDDDGVVLTVDEPVKDVSSGESHKCFVTAEGRVKCFGSNNVGQLDIPFH